MLWHRHVCVASLLGVALLGGIAYGSPGSPAGQRIAPAAQGGTGDRAKYVPNQLLVRFRRGMSKQAIQAEHGLVRAAVLKEFRVVENLQLVGLPAGMSVEQARRYYRSRPDVLYAEPNYFRQAAQAPLTPTDPLYPDMWNLHNTGQSGGTPGADIHAPEAWGLSTGDSSVVVAVIDTGMASTHVDLAANVWSSPTGYTVTLNGRSITCAAGTHGFNAITMTCNPLDDNSHGTHVAGTIGARGDNGTGVVGINWRVQVMACKFLDSGGEGTSSAMITCLEYVALMKDNGVNLVATNNSYGGAGFSQAEKDAVDSHRQRGILFIAAAGNAGANNDLLSFYPANYGLPHMITVAATDRNDALADFSNYGRHSVHLGAPGNEILSTILPKSYAVYSGTSMAAPHVTGVAALLKAQDPARDWKTIKNLLLAGGDAVPSVANTIAQKRLNAYGAMTCSHSVLQSRLQPQDADVYLLGGDFLTFTVLNINCGAPNGLLEVALDGGPETITLADDGVSPDVEANDGIYVAQRQWLASEIGNHTLAFPNNDVVTVHVLPPLSAYTYSTAVPFHYRDIVGTDLHLRDDDSTTIRPPFPIQFGDASFPTLNASSNGNVTFFAPFAEWDNSPLPASGAATLVAPFWDDLSGSVRWEVTGTAPNRELVIEWRNAFAMACLWSESPRDYATFQIVFFENSSDILFNYADVELGAYDPNDPWRGCAEEVNGGASATVGVQSNSSAANQFSFNTASLTDNSSILWQTGQLTPVITQLSPFSVLAANPGVSLHVIGRSFLPGAVIRWNGKDLSTTFVNAGELTANITASDLAAAGTAQITVFNPPPNGGSESAPAFFHVYSSYPVPTLTDIAPNPVPLQLPVESSRASVKVTLTGTNFVVGSVVRWNGTNLRTTALSSTQLQATVTSDIMSIGAHQVTVFSPAPGGGTSNALTVSVVNPAPVLSPGYPFPRFVGAGAPAFTLRAYGTGFTPASVVRWNGSDRSTQFGNAIFLAASIPATDVASLGTAQVTVFNPAPGGDTSNPLTVSIITPPANDKFADATVIPTYPFTLTENTPGATADALDPKPPCIVSPPNVEESVWFSFTPPAGGGFVTADTLGSNYGNDVSAWTGSPGNFVHLGCSYNPYGNYMLGSLSFPVNSAAPIHFIVSTRYIGTTGTLVFNLNVGPGFTLAANPPTNTVSRGSPATYTIRLNPVSGSFNDPIALSCYVEPVGPTCGFSQPTVTLGSVAASVTLTVATASLARLEKPGARAPLFAFWVALPMLGMLAAGGVLPGGKKAKAGIFLALILAVILLGMPAACGGGGGGPGGGGGGVQGQKYTITVVGTSATISQETSVSLTATR
ncbi:MAG: S8 family serine peptidase [Acidobacteriia bacterium]|nr:S8 family serine peptidase [Terriglobia bacterium]